MSALISDPIPLPVQYSARNWISVPYVEESRHGSTSGEAAFGGSGAPSSCVRTYQIYFEDRYEFHKQVLGWPERVASESPGQPPMLSRHPPMMDPEFEWLYATRVSRSVPYGKPFGKRIGQYSGSPYTAYPYAMVTVLFEQLTYNPMEDGQMQAAFLLADGTYDESYRYTTWQWENGYEMVSKPTGMFKFLAASPTLSAEFSQTKGQTIATNNLIVTWHDVPEVGATGLQGSISGTHMLNANILGGLGRVNDAVWHTFPKWTLLFDGVRVLNKSSAVRRNDLKLFSWEQPRLVDIQFTFSLFRPPVAASYAYDGWNLFPFTGDNLWYLATTDGTAGGSKLYAEYDFTKLFRIV